MSDAHLYPARVFWSAEDEGFIAVAPDLPGCSAFGSTQAKALAELQHAVSAWTEAAIAAGNRVPPPSEPAQQLSGKFPLRLPKTLHTQLAEQAEIEGLSLNQYITYLLTRENERHRTQTKSHGRRLEKAT